MKTLFTLLTALVALSGTIYSADSKELCASRKEITSVPKKFGETLQYVARVSEDAVIEFWFNSTKTKWTILVSRANGTTCVKAFGNDVVEIKKPSGRAS